jgi:hypothetical protein
MKKNINTNNQLIFKNMKKFYNSFIEKEVLKPNSVKWINLQMILSFVSLCFVIIVNFI